VAEPTRAPAPRAAPLLHHDVVIQQLDAYLSDHAGVLCRKHISLPPFTDFYLHVDSRPA
jgi:hypothetical protein